MTFEKFCRYFWLSAIKQNAELTGITTQESAEELRKVKFPSDEELYRYYNTPQEDYDLAAKDWLGYLETPAESHIAECRGY